MRPIALSSLPPTRSGLPFWSSSCQTTSDVPRSVRTRPLLPNAESIVPLALKRIMAKSRLPAGPKTLEHMVDVVLQFEGLTRIALVALPDAVLGLDQQTVAHHRHRNRSYGGYCTATLNALTCGAWPNSRKDALASSFESDALPRRQRAGEAQLVAVSVVDVEVALTPWCVRG